MTASNDKPHPLKMKKGFRRLLFRALFFSVLGLLLLVGIAVVFLQTSFFQSRFRMFIEETAASQLNATFHIGDIKGSILSDITLNDISMTTPGDKKVLVLDRISLRYFLPKALFHILHFEEVTIDGIRLYLEKGEDGTWNISGLVKPPADSEHQENIPFPFLVNIDHFHMSDVQIFAADTARSNDGIPSFIVNRFSAGLEYRDALTLSVFNASLVLNRTNPIPLSFAGEFSLFPRTTETSIDHLILESGDARVSVNGDCRFDKTSPVFSMETAVDNLDLSVLSNYLSISGLPKATVSGKANISGTTLDFHHDISFELGNARCTLAGDTGFDDTRGLWTRLSADIQSLDLSGGWMPPGVPLSGIVSVQVMINGSSLQSLNRLSGHTSGLISGLSAAGVPFDTIRFAASGSEGALSIERVEAACEQNLLRVSGNINPNMRRIELNATAHLIRAEAILNPLSNRYPQVLDSLSLDGKTDISVTLEGWFDRPLARFSILSRDLAFASYRSEVLNISGRWQGLPGAEHRLDDLSIYLKGISGDRFHCSELFMKSDWMGWLENPDVDFSVSIRDTSVDRLRMESLDLSGNLKGPPADDGGIGKILLSAAGVYYDENEAPHVEGSVSWKGPITDFSGNVAIETKNVSIFGQRFDGLSLSGRMTPEKVASVITANHRNGSRLEVDGTVSSWKTDNREITLDRIFITTAAPWPESTLMNTTPTRLLLHRDTLKISDCHLTLNSAEITMTGNLSPEGNQDLTLHVDNLEIGDIPGDWNESMGAAGVLSMEAVIGGSLQSPEISILADVKNLSCNGVDAATDLSGTVDYKKAAASFHISLSKQGGGRILNAQGSLPLALSLSPFSATSETGAMTASLETHDLTLSELPIPKIKDVEWDAVADMNLTLSGSLKDPEIAGDLQIRDGRLTLSRNKLTYETLEGRIFLSNDRINIDHLRIEGDREGRLAVAGAIMRRDGFDFDADLTLSGNDFYLPFQKAISARFSPDLRLTGGIDNPRLAGEVTITQSRIDLDRISRRRYSDIEVVETTSTDGNSPLLVASPSQDTGYLSPLSADIVVHVPKNAWLKGQDVSAEISGEITINKKPGGSFLLTGPLDTLRGNYYFMGKNFQLTKGHVEFLGLKEINPSLNIEARTRIRSATIIVALSGTAQDMTIDLGSDPSMDQSDIISYLVFGRSVDDLGGDQAFSVEKTALNYVGGLLATELRDLLGDAAFIDSFSIDSGGSENGIGAVTLGKYITPEIFISRHQGLSENEPSYQEITYELTPDIKLETQVGRAYTNSLDITWEFDY